MTTEILEKNINDVVVIEVVGNLDIESAPTLKIKLENLVRFGHNKIVINLYQSEFIDSTGIGSLMYGLKIVDPIFGGIRLVGLSPQNANILSVLDLDKVFPIHSSVDQAVGSFPEEGATLH